MKTYTYPTVEHYAIATSKYRDQFNYGFFYRGQEELEKATEWIDGLQKYDPAAYNEFMGNARNWVRVIEMGRKPKFQLDLSAPFQLGTAQPFSNGTTECATIKGSRGGTYPVLNKDNIANLDGRERMPSDQPVVFIPVQGGTDPDSGETVRSFAYKVHLLPCEVDTDLENVSAPAGTTRVDVAMVLWVYGDEHIFNATYKVAKLRFLTVSTFKVSDLLKLVSKKLGVEGAFGVAHASVNYDALSPSSSEPLNMRETGRYWADLGLPWHQIGAPGKSNPGRSVDVNKSVDENGLGAGGVLFCLAYKPGNHLTSYPGAGKNDLSWVEVMVDIVT